MSNSAPLVTILTPVYNGELYLIECIRSIIDQKYKNWEYYIINNCSTDSSLHIAKVFSRDDTRVHIVNNEKFVNVIENHNIAFKMVSRDSKYCKIVSADDWLYPECISKLVETAEMNPSAGIVGSYQLSGGGNQWEVKWCGLPYDTTIISGRDICRSTLLGGRYIFGCPTSVLYKSDLVRSAEQFYPNSTPQADVSAFYQYLAVNDFGFVHQILSYERIHDKSVGSHCKKLATRQPSIIRDLLEYGPIYLTGQEIELPLRRAIDQYYELIVEGLFHFEGREFWDYHRQKFREFGIPFFGFKLFKSIIIKLSDLIFNPFNLAKKIWSRFIPR